MFLLNGLGIISQAAAAKALLDHGAPATVVPLMMLSARTLEVVGGFGLAFGLYPRLAAVALVVFLIPATFIGHAFWELTGTVAFTPQLLNFFKNKAMVGGLLFTAATKFQPTLLPRTSRSNAREPARAASLWGGVAVSVSWSANSWPSESNCQFCQWCAASHRASKCPRHPAIPDTLEFNAASH
jgi:putative oxidoreductase